MVSVGHFFGRGVGAELLLQVDVGVFVVTPPVAAATAGQKGEGYAPQLPGRAVISFVSSPRQETAGGTDVLADVTVIEDA